MVLRDMYNFTYAVKDSGVPDELPKHTKCLYSDRMYQWDPDKYNRCALEVFGNTGQFFYNRSNDDIEKFISCYLGYAVTLVAVHVEEHAQNGYPYWLFLYKETEDGRR